MTAADRRTSSAALNEQQAAARLGVTVDDLARARRSPSGPPFYRVGAAVRYLPDELDKWTAQQHRAAERGNLLTEQEVAEYLGVSRAKMRADRRAGGAPPHIKVGQLVRYRRSDVDAWLDGRRAKQPAAERPAP